jgi:SH2 domain
MFLSGLVCVLFCLCLLSFFFFCLITLFLLLLLLSLSLSLSRSSSSSFSSIFLEYSDFMKFYTDVIKGGKRPAFNARWEPALCDLLSTMWAPAAEDRPSMKEVADLLAPLVEKVKHAEQVAALKARVPNSKAQQFWMANFFPETTTKWKEFAPAFYKFLGKTLPEHPVVSGATDLSHSKVGEMEILDEETRELLCLYELIEENGAVNTTKLGRVVASFAPLDGGFLARLVDTLRQPWFFGSIQTKAAEQKLCVQRCGTYLVRFSNSKPGVYCISLVNVNKMVQHLVMQHTSHGYRLDTAIKKFWSTVPEFIQENASKYKLLDECPGWPFEHLFESQKAGIGGYTAQFDDDMDDDDMADLDARFDKVTAGI